MPGHLLAALAGCAMVFVLVFLGLFPLGGIPSGSDWLLLIALFLPFPILTVPLLIILCRRGFRTFWPYVLAAASVAVLFALVLEMLPQADADAVEAGLIPILIGAGSYGLLGSIAGLIFWTFAVRTSRETVSTAVAPTSSGKRSWLRGVATLLYFVPLVLMLALILYGVGHRLFEWPALFGLWARSY